MQPIYCFFVLFAKPLRALRLKKLNAKVAKNKFAKDAETEMK